MPEKKTNPHDNLYYYGGMLVIGLIVVVLGIQQLNWVISLIGAFFSVFGGFEVKLNYNRIQLQEKSIDAAQSGHHNTQISQTSPQNSPVINKADHVYIGTSGENLSSKASTSTRKKSSKSPAEPKNKNEEWLFNGHIHFKTRESREIEFSRGDRIVGHVESNDPISVQIMDARNFDYFDNEEDYDTLWDSGKTSDYEVDYTFKKNGKGNVVIVDEYDEYDDEDDEAQATVRLKFIQSGLS